jgi:hypothetical protein
MELKLPHLDQACPAVFAVQDIEDRPHDRTPLLTGMHAIEGLFQAVFSASEDGFVGMAELFLRNPWPSDESLNLLGRLLSNRWGWIERDEMPESPDFRNWAARVARQAAKARDASEAVRLMSIARYWQRLADEGAWEHDQEARMHQRAS